MLVRIQLVEEPVCRGDGIAWCVWEGYNGAIPMICGT